MVGTKIRDLRKKVGLTQEQLAGSELTKSYVSQVELGRIRPSKNSLQIMAKRLGKPLGYFLDNDDDLRTIDVLLRASEALWMSQRLDEAATGIKEARHLAERTGRDDILAKIDCMMGRLEFSRDHLSEAEKHLKRALDWLSREDAPLDHVQAASTLAQVYARTSRFHEAILSFQDSIDAIAQLPAQSAEAASALIVFADFCHDRGEWTSAISLYKQAGEHLPSKLPQALEVDFKLARLLAQTGVIDEAEAHWNHAWAQFSTLPDGALRLKIAYEAAHAAIQLDFLRAAEPLLETLPVTPQTLDLGVQLALHPDCPSDWARRHAERAIESDQASAKSKAKSYWILARYEDSLSAQIAALQKAVSLDPNNAAILRHYVLNVLRSADATQLASLETTLEPHVSSLLP